MCQCYMIYFGELLKKDFAIFLYHFFGYSSDEEKYTSVDIRNKTRIGYLCMETKVFILNIDKSIVEPETLYSKSCIVFHHCNVLLENPDKHIK